MDLHVLHRAVKLHRHLEVSLIASPGGDTVADHRCKIVSGARGNAVDSSHKELGLARATWFPRSTGVGLLVGGTPLVLMYAVAFFLQSVN